MQYKQASAHQQTTYNIQTTGPDEINIIDRYEFLNSPISHNYTVYSCERQVSPRNSYTLVPNTIINEFYSVYNKSGQMTIHGLVLGTMVGG